MSPDGSTEQLSNESLEHLRDTLAAHVAPGDLPGLISLVARGDDVQIDVIAPPSFTADAPL